MRAITLWQPWASLVAVGAKRYETRSWPAPKTLRHGDLLAIHAAARPGGWPDDGETIDAMIAALFPKPGALPGLGLVELDELPRGAVLAVACFRGCYRAEEVRDTLPEDELLFGDWGRWRYGWKLEIVRAFDTPIPARGYQGLWNWPDGDVLARELGITEVSR